MNINEPRIPPWIWVEKMNVEIHVFCYKRVCKGSSENAFGTHFAKGGPKRSPKISKDHQKHKKDTQKTPTRRPKSDHKRATPEKKTGSAAQAARPLNIFGCILKCKELCQEIQRGFVRTFLFIYLYEGMEQKMQRGSMSAFPHWYQYIEDIVQKVPRG